MAKNRDDDIGKDDVAAGAAGDVIGGTAAGIASGLGGAGLAIGGTAVGLSALAVVGIPAVAGAAVGFTAWKIFKAVKKKKKQ